MTNGHIYSLDAKGIPAQLSNGYRELWRARVDLENHEILVLTLDREARDKLLEVLRLGHEPMPSKVKSLQELHAEFEKSGKNRPPLLGPSIPAGDGSEPRSSLPLMVPIDDGDVPIRKFDDRYKFKASDLADDGDGLPLNRRTASQEAADTLKQIHAPRPLAPDLYTDEELADYERRKRGEARATN